MDAFHLVAMSEETRSNETEASTEDVPLEEILKRVLRTLREDKTDA